MPPGHKRLGMPKDGLETIGHFIRVQMALGNWPYNNVWDGDGVLIALVDTYESLHLYH